MENKKKIIISIVIGILVIGLFVSTMFIGEKEYQSITSEDPSIIMQNAENESQSISNREMKELKEINVTTYLEYYKSSDTNIVFLGRPTCPYCEIAKPIISKLAKDYKFDVSYLNTDNFSEDDNVHFVSHNELFSDGYSTPMILIVSNNQIVYYFEGLTDTAHYIDFFKSIGLIKE